MARVAAPRPRNLTVMESRYRNPSRASLRAEQDRDARRRRHRQAGLALGTASVAAAGIAAAYRVLQNAWDPKSSDPEAAAKVSTRRR